MSDIAEKVKAIIVDKLGVDESEVTVHVAELRVDGVGGLAVGEGLRVPLLVGAQRAELVVELGRARADRHGGGPPLANGRPRRRNRHLR